MNLRIQKLLCTSLLFATLSFTVVSENGRAGYTGSPGESTCSTTNCHTGQANNSMGGSVVISSPDLTDWIYIPGNTYTIEVTVTQDGRSLFGTGFEALLSDGHNAGLLTPGDDTQIKSKTVSGVSRKNIVHIENGGTTDDNHTFVFTWTAPPVDSGDVTFFCAGNAANGNGQRTGDYIYTTSQLVTEAPVGINNLELAKAINLSLFPNPAKDVLNISYSLLNSSDVKIRIHSSDGKLAWEVLNEKQLSGLVTREVEVSHLASGVYMVVLSVDGKELPARLFRK